jgi:hypothetical protein
MVRDELKVGLSGQRLEMGEKAGMEMKERQG